jgi:hypothetical protein
MDFITKLPITTCKQHDSIMVVADKLNKVSHFILVKLMHKARNIIDICIREIARLQGIPKTIVIDKESKFTSNVWKYYSKGLGPI